MRGAGDPAPFPCPRAANFVVPTYVPVMTGQRTGRRDHDSGTPRELGCLQTWKGEVKTMYGSTNSEGGSMKFGAEGQIARSKVQRESAAEGTPSESQSEQYSMAKILGIWAAAALPMGALAWVVAPLVAGQLDGPAPLMRALLASLTVGLIWQFALVVVLVYRERGSLSWSVLKEALWLHSPRSPKTGRVGGRLWLVVIP